MTNVFLVDGGVTMTKTAKMDLMKTTAKQKITESVRKRKGHVIMESVCIS